MTSERDTTFGFLVVIALVIFAFILAWGCGTDAFGADGFQLRRAGIEGGQYVGANHDAYILLDSENGERLQHSTDMILDVDLACTLGNDVCLYWNNRVASKASNQQYRSVGWIFQVGFALGEHIEVGWNHISIHELDRKSNQTLRYPLENKVILSLLFVNKPRQYGGK